MAEKHQDKMTNAMNNSKLYLIQSFGCQMNERDAESLGCDAGGFGLSSLGAQAVEEIIL